MTSFSLERANGGINSPTAAIFSAVRADLVGLPLPARRVTADHVSSTDRPDGKSSASCSSSSFVRITCSYRFSPKSLLAKCLNTHSVFITQLTHHKKTLTNDRKIVSLILQRPAMTSKMTSYFKEY